MPTRFKYRNVESENFGLDTNLILKSTDQDLNSFVSLKKLAPFRNKEKNQQWMQKFKKQKSKKLKELVKIKN